MKKILPVIASFFLISCSQKNISSTVKDLAKTVENDRPVIGFSIDTLAIERWQRDLDIFIASCREEGTDVIVQNAGNSVEEQNRQLMYLMERGTKVIVVVPKDADSISESVEKIRQKNIPVISYDRLTLNADISLYITIDSQKVGELMGEHMKKISGTKKNWAFILGPQEDFNMTMILDGLKKTIGSEYFSSEIFYTAGWNYDLSKQKMIELISRSNLPDAIVCGNDAVADSVISVLKTYYPETHIPICGQDADIAACQNIVEGLQDFTVYKPITSLARKTAQIAVDLAKGGKVEDLGYSQTINNGYAEIPAIMLSPRYVDKNNIDKEIIESGFHTRGEVYR